jgi:hypothetical protein
MNEMNRGEMIRQLDDASKEVLHRLTNGPLEDTERHALARSLIRLLPVVADSLQTQEDRQAAEKLMEHLERWEIEARASKQLAESEQRDATDATPHHVQVDEEKWF